MVSNLFIQEYQDVCTNIALKRNRWSFCTAATLLIVSDCTLGSLY